MDILRWFVAASMAVAAGIGGGALSVAVVNLVWPTDATNGDNRSPATHATIGKGDRLDRADVACWSDDGRPAPCR